MVIDPVTVYSKQIITGLVTEFRMLSKILISTYVRQNYQRLPHNRCETLPTCKRRKTTGGIDYCRVFNPQTSACINERFPCTQRSTQKNFRAATGSRLKTDVEYTKDMMKIFQPFNNDRS